MAIRLEGKQVIAALNKKMISEIAELKTREIAPLLAIVRIGERYGDIAYEKSAMKRSATIGVEVRNIILPAESTQDEILHVIGNINQDNAIHGCLLLRPLPKNMDDNIVRNALSPAKDVDGITDSSLAVVFSGTGSGFPPCTAQACMEILDHFNIDVSGKKAVVIGRSLVVGKPIAMMLIQKNATVTICHTKTADMPAICREAELLIVAAGQPKLITASYLSTGQTVIDVGINVGEDGKLCGDVDFEQAEHLVGKITPVPGGVGIVTTSIMVKHVIEAAMRTLNMTNKEKQ